MTRLEFRVIGTPRPGGSKKGFYNKKLGRVMVVDACGENKTWRQAVIAAIVAKKPETKLTGPLKLHIDFFLKRPMNHYKANDPAKGLKATAPRYNDKKPDCGKYIRSTEDAITDTSLVWYDDAQVAIQTGIKYYTDNETGANIIIENV